LGLAVSSTHEVNQPITAMVTNAQAALRLLDCQAMNLEEVRSAPASIIQDGNRSCKVIGCMLQRQDVGRAFLKSAPLFYRREKAACLSPQRGAAIDRPCFGRSK
jgi:hypothetical protein